MRKPRATPWACARQFFRALKGRDNVGHSAFSGLTDGVRTSSPGRCPGLSYSAPFGAASDRDISSNSDSLASARSLHPSSVAHICWTACSRSSDSSVAPRPLKSGMQDELGRFPGHNTELSTRAEEYQVSTARSRVQFTTLGIGWPINARRQASEPLVRMSIKPSSQ